MNLDISSINGYFADAQIEESLLKSFLLISHATHQKNAHNECRTSLLKKYILSRIIGKENYSLKDLLQDLSHKNIDEGQVNTILGELQKKDKLISIRDGLINVIPEKLNYTQDKMDELTSVLSNLADSVFNSVQKEYRYSINNPHQVKYNIKEAIIYYIVVSGLSFFDVELQKSINNNDKIVSIIDKGLSKNEELRDVIIEQLGKSVEHPSDVQKEWFNLLTRVLVATRMLDLDPLMQQFKATKLMGKVFVLDTDVVLFALTDNATYSKQYLDLLKRLKQSGCEIYIPEEVIEEVFDHAEAAIKKYHYLHNILDFQEDYVQDVIKNIFLIDYYYSFKGHNDNSVVWNTFIGNFYEKNYCKYTREAIKERFKGIAKIGLPEINGKTPEKSVGNEDYDKLYDVALKATMETEKAKYREDSKNEKIAATDTKLYLTIRELNNMVKTDNSILLGKNYYLLTGFTRIHFCAQEVGIETGYLCKPKTLIAYMREVGLYNSDTNSYNSLFENPFFLYLAYIAKDDIDNIIKVGIDFKGVRGLVRLRYDVKKDVDTILSNVDKDDKISAYQNIGEKGYYFIKDIQFLLDNNSEHIAQHQRDEDEKKQLKEKNAQLTEEIKKMKQKEKNDNRQYLKGRLSNTKRKNKKYKKY